MEILFLSRSMKTGENCVENDSSLLATRECVRAVRKMILEALVQSAPREMIYLRTSFWCSYQSNEMLEWTVQKFVDASLSGALSDCDSEWQGDSRFGGQL